MKKFFGTLTLILICYIILFDLEHGTLPATSKEVKEISKPVETPDLLYFEEKVQAGDTVLTIVENKLKEQIPVSIEEVVKDFNKLNDGTTPEKIQIGKTYRFPDYSNE